MPRFDFYLHDLSFQYQSGVTLSQLQEKVEHLARDCRFIREEGKEKIFRCDSIYEVPIFEGDTIMDVIWPNTTILSPDQRLYLQIIIDRSTETALTNDEIIELLPEHDQDLVNGLLCLHNIDAEVVPSEHLVYSENDWRQFHRHFLGIYPGDPSYFLRECGKCYPNLYLHHRNEQSLTTFKGGHGRFACKIRDALAYLNDVFLQHLSGDIPKSLRAFSVASGFETSNEGDAGRKKNFTFEFARIAGGSSSICCEPHIKLTKSDASGDSEFYFYRIYFHPGTPDIAGGKILVGHIGEHL